MSTEKDLLEQIAVREKASRREAERLLEVKSREVYEKKAEIEQTSDALRQANMLLSGIMSAVPDCIVTFDAAFRIRTANHSAQRALGYDAETIDGRVLDDILPGITDALNVRETGAFVVEQLAATRADATAFPIELRGQLGGIAEGVHGVLVFHDISKRLEAEARRRRLHESLEESRRLEAIGALSAGIAHEINTPIQFIGDNIEYLKTSLKQINESYERYEALLQIVERDQLYVGAAAKVRAFNRKIDLKATVEDIRCALDDSRDGIHQVRDIIRVMKEFSHKGTGEKHLIDLNELVDNVCTISRSRTKGVVELELVTQEDLPEISCRRSQVRQALLNIVLNAADAIESQPPDARRAGQPKIRIETFYNDEVVGCEISDTGPGVPAGIASKIFDPFFTTKAVGKGTGQGLALAKEHIVAGHNGSLTLGAREGYSTTFTIVLPRADVEAEMDHEGEQHEAA